MSGRSKILTWGLPFVGIVTLVAGTGMVMKNRPQARVEVPPRQPTTAPSPTEAVDASRFIGALGVSEPAGESIAIAAHTAGVVVGVDVKVGAQVRAGDPLFRIDTRRAAALVAFRTSEIAVARADVLSLRSSIPARRAAVTLAMAALESAKANVLAAQADRDDRANLVRMADSVSDKRAISTEEVDRRRFSLVQAEARVATAIAGVAEAQARIAEAQADLSRLVDPLTDKDGPEILASIARIEQAEQEMQRSQADLEVLTVTSPITGQVLQVNIRPGEFAPASVPTEGLVVLGASGARHVRVEIDEIDIPRFQSSARAWASPRGNASKRLDLKLVLVEPLVVPKRTLSGRTSELIDTRVLQVVYALPEEYESPGTGQVFDVYVEVQSQDREPSATLD